MTKLTQNAVEAIMENALLKDDEMTGDHPPDDAIKVDGVVHKFAFNPERLMASKVKIDELLSELPDPFHRSKGGGWSFLNACQDKSGELWGQHQDIERLVCLGIGVGSASWLMKEMAEILPGGMPYLEVHPAETIG